LERFLIREDIYEICCSHFFGESLAEDFLDLEKGLSLKWPTHPFPLFFHPAFEGASFLSADPPPPPRHPAVGKPPNPPALHCIVASHFRDQRRDLQRQGQESWNLYDEISSISVLKKKIQLSFWD